MAVQSSNWAAWIWAFIITVGVAAMTAYSMLLNWQYGREFLGGEAPGLSLPVAAGCAVLDCAKFILAAQAFGYWRIRSYLAVCSRFVLVSLLSLLSFTATVGVGIQGAQKLLAEGRAERQSLQDLRARRADLMDQIQELGTTLPLAVIAHQMDALQRDGRWQSTAERDRLLAQLAAATKAERLQAAVEQLNREIRTTTNAESLLNPWRVMSVLASWLALETDALDLRQLVVFAIFVELLGVALSVVAGAQLASLRVRSAPTTTVPLGTAVEGAPAGIQRRRQANRSGRNRARRGGGSAAAGSDAEDAGISREMARVAGEDARHQKMHIACPLEFWDELVVPAPGARIAACELYAAYQTWSLRRGKNALSQTSFGKALTRARGAKRKKSNGRMVYVGVAFGSDMSGERKAG